MCQAGLIVDSPIFLFFFSVLPIYVMRGTNWFCRRWRSTAMQMLPLGFWAWRDWGRIVLAPKILLACWNISIYLCSLFLEACRFGQEINCSSQAMFCHSWDHLNHRRRFWRLEMKFWCLAAETKAHASAAPLDTAWTIPVPTSASFYVWKYYVTTAS